MYCMPGRNTFFLKGTHQKPRKAQWQLKASNVPPCYIQQAKRKWQPSQFKTSFYSKMHMEGLCTQQAKQNVYLPASQQKYGYTVYCPGIKAEKQVLAAHMSLSPVFPTIHCWVTEGPVTRSKHCHVMFLTQSEL